jgi:hypothetical protein
MNMNRISRRIMIFLFMISMAALLLTGCKIPAMTLSPGAGNTTSQASSTSSEPDDANQSTDNASSTDKTTQPDDNQPGITADPTDERLSFQGKVISIDSSGHSFLVAVAEKDQQLLGDKATVGLYADATVTWADTGKAVDLLDIPIDSEVTVTITGGIRESYPVQVSAVSVVVTPAEG